MESEYSLEIWGPESQEITVCLPGDKKRLTIGRKDDNDIVLVPDQQKKVSRQHCILEKEEGYWCVSDNASANGTFLLRDGTKIDVQQKGRVRLEDKDVILILAELPPEGNPIFWKLTFRDFEDTHKLPAPQLLKPLTPQLPFDYLEYSLSQKMLFGVSDPNRKNIQLTPQERKMIDYMALENQKKNGAVLCKYDDLIGAIWDDSFGHNRDNVNNLVWRLRQKIEQDSRNPRFIKTVAEEGYILEIRVLE